MDSPTRSPENPINLRDVARRVHENLFRANRVERFQTISRKTVARCLPDTHDKVLSNDRGFTKIWKKPFLKNKKIKTI